MINIKLKQLLKEKGMTQKELSEKTGLYPTIISEMVRNTRTTINKEHLEAVMKVLGVTDISEIIEYKA
ncbi:helix-turn-helix domain-containing protein [Kurthia populi]|uniref:Helix-turn-helix domain-containing protein n=1 Tax=Kurthia populi TaxID=1562132 RepID=A0ABW5Y200_9BACL